MEKKFYFLSIDYLLAKREKCPHNTGLFSNNACAKYVHFPLPTQQHVAMGRYYLF